LEVQVKDWKDDHMQIADKIIMFSMAVSNMPKSKAFYSDILGFKVAKDYRIDDDNWWVSITLPDGETSFTLTTNQENMKPGTIKVYFASSDVLAANKELVSKGAKVNDIKDDLFGPGSGVKWFSLEDPDGNQVFLAQI
jgi:catechol 2,3-dioxygenase-like lactoylglutathione lyase family enzyme